MDQQLRDLSAMWLVRRPGRMELDSPHDPLGIASDEENCPGGGGRYRPAPPVFGALDRQRRQKTHRSPRLDRVDKKSSERSEIGVAHRQTQSLDSVRWLGHGWLTAAQDGDIEALDPHEDFGSISPLSKPNEALP
jgi:hypothetical protein